MLIRWNADFVLCTCSFHMGRGVSKRLWWVSKYLKNYSKIKCDKHIMYSYAVFIGENAYVFW